MHRSLLAPNEISNHETNKTITSDQWVASVWDMTSMERIRRKATKEPGKQEPLCQTASCIWIRTEWCHGFSLLTDDSEMTRSKSSEVLQNTSDLISLWDHAWGCWLESNSFCVLLPSGYTLRKHQRHPNSSQIKENDFTEQESLLET